jgi:hypothetical protein
MNAALAAYQVDAWLSIVTDLGFSGIHWDTLGSIAQDKDAEADGVAGFTRAAGNLLAAHGLPQTMNQIDTNWWDGSLFDQGVLAFPYAEVWGLPAESMFYKKSPRGGVIANYPGSMRNGCCCLSSSDCGACKRSQYPHCPNNWTQEAVLEARWQAAWKHQLRYLVVGNGLERLIDEYFPETASLSTASIHLIQRQSFPAEGNFNFRSWQESWQVLLILVLTVVVWSLVLMVALRRDWIARVQSGARHPSALSEGTAVTDGRRLLTR